MDINSFHLSDGNYPQLIEVAIGDYTNHSGEELFFKIEVRSLEASNCVFIDDPEDVECTEDEEEVQARHAGLTSAWILKGILGK